MARMVHQSTAFQKYEEVDPKEYGWEWKQVFVVRDAAEIKGIEGKLAASD